MTAQRKEKITEIILVICVFYTIISMINAGIEISKGREVVSSYNQIMIFVWSAIGTIVVYSHSLFEPLPPVVIIGIQYIIGTGLIVLIIFISSFYEPLHPDAYFDGIRSFTIPFAIGAFLYYRYVFAEANKQNDLLQEIKDRS